MAVVALAGAVAQRPGRGGHAWVFLNYVLGLRRLGHDVVFVDRLTADMRARGSNGDAPGASAEERWLATVVERMGLGDAHVLLGDEGGSIAGLSRAAALERLAGAALLINVNGFLDDPELLAAPEARAFLDIDPGFLQIWEELGLATIFDGHDLFFSVGQNVGADRCAIPSCGRDWIPTRQPVVLSEWPVTTAGDAFTSVATWRGPFAPLEYRGETYGLRAHAFRRFADLPAHVDASFEIALDIDAADADDASALRSRGWRLSDPLAVAGEPPAYRSFVQGSRAELSIAKDLYVRSRSGWFSDRSACYLASGRPVLAQDTGLGEHLPLGTGLVCFDDLDGAIAGAAEICADWPAHSRAAREIAESHFDSDAVLGELLAVAGL